MKTPRPFRILLIEDEEKGVSPLLSGQRYEAGNEYYFLDVLRTLSARPQFAHAPIEIYWSQRIDFQQTILTRTKTAIKSEFRKESVLRIFPPPEADAKGRVLLFDSPDRWGILEEKKGGALSAFLQSMDIVVLDLAVPGKLPVAPSTIVKNFGPLKAPEITDKALEAVGSSFPGIIFYHSYLEDLKSVQLVVVLSAFDNRAKSESAIATLLHPFCGLHSHTPFTVKYGKASVSGEGERSSLHSRVECLYRDYSEGYTQLRYLGQIEQAANHDYPVMIVGESGTGKEYVAGAIHRRWLAEKRRSNPDVSDNLVILNCAGLSAELARSELFGHVAGSFTGANDHRLGAVLRACGCKSVKAARRSIEDARADSEAYKQFESLILEIAELDSLESDAERVQRIKVIKRTLDKILVSDFRSLLSFLRDVNRQLHAALSGHDLVYDFWVKLLDANKQLLDKIKTDAGQFEELGIDFKLKEPIGTLFLDEFGDLPPEVQNLLLRFLEEKSGEIQPVGYSGRITGIKIRLILATSDPRIAMFAGYDDMLGTHRSDHELQRSLRHDLLFRVKGQVIRPGAIATQAQLWDALNEMIDRHSRFVWSTSAKNYLAGDDGEITKVLKQMSPGSGGGQASGRVFGQWRELRRIIDLANSFMLTAERRGLRLDSDEITQSIVETIWRPSRLLMTAPVNYAAISVSDSKTEGDAQAKIVEWLTDKKIPADDLNYNKLVSIIPSDQLQNFVDFVKANFTGRRMDSTGFVAVMCKGQKAVPASTIKATFTNAIKKKKSKQADK
ncbi:MAG TPA: sigma 54-interacting transcriptional regulator [Candidatus Paceibacterota bacterium]|nr:sigma 54-interacting transcriptional regulator [Candidatus Paceibacterota bacterium]